MDEIRLDKLTKRFGDLVAVDQADLTIGQGEVFVVLPGPNVIGYYFLFRIAGHYLSMRGARHALSKTSWTLQPSAPLTTLRSVVEHPAADRAKVVVGVASSLQLEHLAQFFERCAT